MSLNSNPGSWRPPPAPWRELARVEFQSFHRCAVDPARLELDRVVIEDILGLGSEGEETAQRLRRILAAEPSIHGSKDPALG